MRKISAAENHVRAARARASFLRPYFSAAIFSLVLVESPSCPSMAVDIYKRLYFNPKWVLQYTVPQITTVILHEIGHVLREHCRRALGIGITRETASLANVAQDCELNDDFQEEADRDDDLEPLPEPKDPNILALPETHRGPFFPWKIGCEDGELWEVYYQHLLERERDPDNGSIPDVFKLVLDCGSGAHGIARPWEAGDPLGAGADTEAVFDADWEDIKDLVARAIKRHSQTYGSVPGGWLDWANVILTPPAIQWDQELASQLRWGINDASGMVFHSYKRPSRRQSAFPDVVMPQMRRPVPFVGVVGDTSGSMDEERLAYVRGVVRDICMSLGARLAFIATDTNVHGGMQLVHDGADVELRGRGGTNMSVGIEYAMTSVSPKPNVLVVCTDCETPWPAVAPPVRVIVCAIGASPHWIARVPKWARVIEVPLKEAA